MNLIEQLGGYSMSHAYHESLSDGATACVIGNIIHSKESLGLSLLEYRRQHNIYEVGDKVVLLNWDNNSKIYSIKNVYEHELYDDGQYSYSTFIYLLDGWSYERWFNNRKIRHATDEEIKAGKRLEVNDGN